MSPSYDYISHKNDNISDYKLIYIAADWCQYILIVILYFIIVTLSLTIVALYL